MQPRDQVLQLGVPVNPWTGRPLPPVLFERVQRYRQAEREFRLALHELTGTTEGSRPGDARMIEAFRKLDEVTLWMLAGLLQYENS
jgi:hypothetical protein